MKVVVQIFILLFCFESFSQGDTVSYLADRMAYFPNGMGSCVIFIQKNIKYPAEARENAYQGSGIVQFIVDTNGKILNPVILKSSGHKCLNDEAVTVFNKMPNWIPATNSGKKVRTFVNLPFKFSIGGKSFDNDIKSQLLITKNVKESDKKTAFQKDSLSKLNKANYYYYLGVLEAENENLKEALVNFNESIINNEIPDALYNKALMNFKLNQKKEACGTWNRLLIINKNDTEVAELIKKHCN